MGISFVQSETCAEAPANVEERSEDYVTVK